MSTFNRNHILLTLLALAIIAVGVYAFFGNRSVVEEPAIVPEVVEIVEPTPQIQDEVIGKSVGGRNIRTYTYGSGDDTILFVGGMHGGYEWNSTLLAYEVMDYLEANPDVIPENLSLSIIPSLNPDGLAEVVGKEGRFALTDVVDPTTRVATARFNENKVDLNRNFDCKWAPESTWRGNVVSAGAEAFSEPEAAAFRDFVLAEKPKAVLFWHSQANNVYASECENGVLPETLALMNAYANAASYGAVPSFDAYPITGDAEGWLASIGIPAVTIELEGHRTTELARNLAGITATLERYGVAK